MSILSNKYNIPEETVKKMIQDGVVSCSWPGYEEVYSLWKAGEKIDDIVFKTGKSRRTVYDIIKRLK